jgi:hypothetical protein
MVVHGAVAMGVAVVLLGAIDGQLIQTDGFGGSGSDREREKGETDGTRELFVELFHYYEQIITRGEGEEKAKKWPRLTLEQ